jgi:crotonobetainyl-CoA dehydrogenase
MDFRLTEEQELLIQSLTELLQREAPESEMAELDKNHEFPWKGWRALADNGFFGLGIPEEYGGTPTDVMTLTLVCETMGKLACPVAAAYVTSIIMTRDILQFGSEKQKQEVLRGLIEGDPPIALGITEPQAGSDASAIKTSATPEGDHYVIEGQKIYTSLASIAKYILLMTRDSSIENPYKSMSMWLMPTDTKGVRINTLEKVGGWTIPACEVFIDGAILPKDALLGELNNGWKQLMANFEIERLATSAVPVGVAQAAFEDAITYAGQRVQFGQPIGNFQLVQEMIARMAIKIETMRSMIYKVAWMMDNNIDVRIENAMAKLYCAQSTFEVIDDAMQILGGVGYMMDHRIQRMWRDSRAYRIGGGTDQVMITIIGSQLLKKFNR